jgi:transcriptional regulator with XRE-family HTH domain
MNARKPSPEIRKKVAANLKALRKARLLTQQDLAARCGFRRNYVSNVEQATVNITLASIEELAKGLGCPEYLLLK